MLHVRSKMLWKDLLLKLKLIKYFIFYKIIAVNCNLSSACEIECVEEKLKNCQSHFCIALSWAPKRLPKWLVFVPDSTNFYFIFASDLNNFWVIFNYFLGNFWLIFAPKSFRMIFPRSKEEYLGNGIFYHELCKRNTRNWNDYTLPWFALLMQKNMCIMDCSLLFLWVWPIAQIMYI